MGERGRGDRQAIARKLSCIFVSSNLPGAWFTPALSLLAPAGVVFVLVLLMAVSSLNRCVACAFSDDSSLRVCYGHCLRV